MILGRAAASTAGVGRKQGMGGRKRSGGEAEKEREELISIERK